MQSVVIPITAWLLSRTSFWLKIRWVLWDENLMIKTSSSSSQSDMYYSIDYDRQYISNTAWVISTTPWYYPKKIWKALSETQIRIFLFEENISKTIYITRNTIGTVHYNHNLWKIPKLIIAKMQFWVWENNTNYKESYWTRDSSGNKCIYRWFSDTGMSYNIIQWTNLVWYISEVTENRITIEWTGSTESYIHNILLSII
jgi:hypothetical protein